MSSLCFASIKLVCYQVAPCCSDQGADFGQRVRGPDKYILDLFSLTLLQDFSLSSSRLRDYMCTCHLTTTVLIFLRYSMKLAELGTLRQLSCHLIYSGAMDFFLDPDTT
jgi:hypothetical protein